MGTQWIKKENGIAWEESRLLHRAGLCHGVTGRGGGVSKECWQSLNLSLAVGDDMRDVLENRRRLCDALGISVRQMTTVQQGQGNHIVVVGKEEWGSGAGSAQDALPHADALMTNIPGALLLVQVADAVPVILFDAKQKACAVIHAGLYNTAAHITTKTVWAMEFVYGSQPQELTAYIGPSVCPAHLTVSKEMANRLARVNPGPADVVREEKGVFTADVKALQYYMLCQAGLQPDHIDVSRQCVYETPQRFFSYRRDGGRTGRMAAFAMVPSFRQSDGLFL